MQTLRGPSLSDVVYLSRIQQILKFSWEFWKFFIIWYLVKRIRQTAVPVVHHFLDWSEPAKGVDLGLEWFGMIWGWPVIDQRQGLASQAIHYPARITHPLLSIIAKHIGITSWKRLLLTLITCNTSLAFLQSKKIKWTKVGLINAFCLSQIMKLYFEHERLRAWWIHSIFRRICL